RPGHDKLDVIVMSSNRQNGRHSLSKPRDTTDGEQNQSYSKNHCQSVGAGTQPALDKTRCGLESARRIVGKRVRQPLPRLTPRHARCRLLVTRLRGVETFDPTF